MAFGASSQLPRPVEGTRSAGLGFQPTPSTGTLDLYAADIRAYNQARHVMNPAMPRSRKNSVCSASSAAQRHPGRQPPRADAITSDARHREKSPVAAPSTTAALLRTVVEPRSQTWHRPGPGDAGRSAMRRTCARAACASGTVQRRGEQFAGTLGVAALPSPYRDTAAGVLGEGVRRRRDQY